MTRPNSGAGPSSHTAKGEMVARIELYEEWRREVATPDPEMATDIDWLTIARTARDAAREHLIWTIEDTGIGYADHAGYRYRLSGGDVVRERLAPKSGPRSKARTEQP
jgi:hypothetical protein